MTRWLCLIGMVWLLAMAGSWLAEASTKEFHAPEPLEQLWEQHMLEGKASSVGIAVAGSQVSIYESRGLDLSLETVRQRTGSFEGIYAEPYGINVSQRGEGFWRTGGWNVLGGVLSRRTDGSAIIQLYAKTISHLHPYFPLNPDTSADTGYEFVLVQRKEGLAGATIVRKWRFSPDEVVKVETRSGRQEENVRAFFSYDLPTHTATLKVTGLTRPFEESVDLSSLLKEGMREEKDGRNH